VSGSFLCVVTGAKSVSLQLRAVLFTLLQVAGYSQKKCNDRRLMKLGEEGIVLTDRSNLIHNVLRKLTAILSVTFRFIS
jgi:hypothetical protein